MIQHCILLKFVHNYNSLLQNFCLSKFSFQVSLKIRWKSNENLMKQKLCKTLKHRFNYEQNSSKESKIQCCRFLWPEICLASRLIVILNIQSNFDFSYLNILAEHFTEVGFNLWSNMPPESLVEVWFVNSLFIFHKNLIIILLQFVSCPDV